MNILCDIIILNSLLMQQHATQSYEKTCCVRMPSLVERAGAAQLPRAHMLVSLTITIYAFSFF